MIVTCLSVFRIIVTCAFRTSYFSRLIQSGLEVPPKPIVLYMRGQFGNIKIRIKEQCNLIDLSNVMKARGAHPACGYEGVNEKTRDFLDVV